MVDPAPIIASVERLQAKGGREVVARCPTEADGEEAAAWLVDRISRLARAHPDRRDRTRRRPVPPGPPGLTRPPAGQFLLVLRA